MNPDGTRSVDRDWDQSETLRQIEEVYKSGKVKAIGVANWSIPYLEKLSKTWKVVPAVNQVELHPFLPQHKLREYCAKHDILLEAYSPLGSAGEWKICHDEHIYLVVANLGSSFRRTYHVRRQYSGGRKEIRCVPCYDSDQLPC